MGDQRIGPHEADTDDATHADDPTTERRPSYEGSLHLRGVLDSALPHELGTDDEPPLYTVAAVFSRRVSPEERELIEAPEVLTALAQRGYPGIGLTVEDRRLLITSTNLAMLEAGLAGEIATVLRDVEERIAAERVERAAELKRWSAAEAARAAGVKAEADGIVFE